MIGKMELIENTAITDKHRLSGVFTPKDVLSAYSVDFLDDKWCRAWVLERLHSGSPVCPGCKEEVPDRLMQSYCGGNRIKCDHCGKYFTALTDTFLSGAHLDFRGIVLLTLLLALGVADKQIASILKMSAENVRLWRHRFESINRAQQITSGE